MLPRCCPGKIIRRGSASGCASECGDRAVERGIESGASTGHASRPRPRKSSSRRASVPPKHRPDALTHYTLQVSPASSAQTLLEMKLLRKAFHKDHTACGKGLHLASPEVQGLFGLRMPGSAPVTRQPHWRRSRAATRHHSRVCRPIRGKSGASAGGHRGETTRTEARSGSFPRRWAERLTHERTSTAPFTDAIVMRLSR